jgi:hypothetical protein
MARNRISPEKLREMEEKILQGFTLTRFTWPEREPGEDDFSKPILDSLWPAGVDVPREITVIQSRWDFSEAHNPTGFFPDRDADYGEGPKIWLRMPNGAELTIEDIDPSQQESSLEEFRGDWEEYFQGSVDVRYAVIDATTEILARTTEYTTEKG